MNQVLTIASLFLCCLAVCGIAEAGRTVHKIHHRERHRGATSVSLVPLSTTTTRTTTTYAPQVTTVRTTVTRQPVIQRTQVIDTNAPPPPAIETK